MNTIVFVNMTSEALSLLPFIYLLSERSERQLKVLTRVKMCGMHTQTVLGMFAFPSIYVNWSKGLANIPNTNDSANEHQMHIHNQSDLFPRQGIG